MSRNRFYKDVSVDSAGALHRILLDGKPVKTPGGAMLALPSTALAQAIADEWRAQESTIKPQTMMLTKLANTAIDRVLPNPASTREQLLAFAKSDVVCYRAQSPSDLVSRQDAVWNPLLIWMQECFDVQLQVASALTVIEPSKAALSALETTFLNRDPFSLAAIYAAAALCSSLVIALALAERRLDSEGAFAAANLEKVYQAERWGWDPQEIAKADTERAELNQISRFLDRLRQ